MPAAEAPIHPLAHLLFADTPLDGSTRDSMGVSTFLHFNDREGAIRRLNSAYSNPINESRMRLTAAATLRAWGEPVTTKEPMLGAVVEYPMETGVDYVAAYADGSARYLNYTGAGIIWDTPRTVDAVDAAVIAFLNKSLAMLPNTVEAARWSPLTGTTLPRITCLTLTGNRAFTPPGPAEVVTPFNACINAAIGLMTQLIERSRQQR
ncbi:MAG: hypothetical protein QM783_01015 [Phycisphaerales bacterium]